MERNIEDRVRDPRYPYDLYDDEDYIVEKRNSELKREMVAHLIAGTGIGIMLCAAAAFVLGWYYG